MLQSAPTLMLRPPRAVTRRIVTLCWLAILAEGFDVGVLGVILPALSADPAWHLSPIALGALGSYGLAGMLIGGALIGTLADLYGRKWPFVLCVVVFSCCMGASAAASTPGWFGLFRFAGGLALGGIIPLAAAYTVEFSPPERRGLNYGLMYSGYSGGALVAALVGLLVVPALGWRSLLWVGVLPLLVALVAARALPESIAFLIAAGRRGEAVAVAERCGMALPGATPDSSGPRPVRLLLGDVVGKRHGGATASFWLAIAAGLLLVYGLGTWLPQIMRQAGYDLGSSLLFLAVFSTASGLGGIGAGLLADRRGMRTVAAGAFLLGAASIAALSVHGPLAVNIALVALAGLGSISASLILTARIAAYYPPAIRSSATGLALSVGRLGAMAGPLLGGVLASSHVAVAWNFYAFAAVGLVAAAATALGPRAG